MATCARQAFIPKTFAKNLLLARIFKSRLSVISFEVKDSRPSFPATPAILRVTNLNMSAISINGWILPYTNEAKKCELKQGLGFLGFYLF